MSINVTTFSNGKWRQRCYILNNDSNEVLIIDPGSQAEDIISIIDQNRWVPLAVFNTHAHYDHIGAISDLIDYYGIPIYLHGDDMDLLKRANMYKLVFDSSQSIRLPSQILDLKDLNKKVTVGRFLFSWIPTPGHTNGGVCYVFPGCLFTGDTLLKNGQGRTDLPGGDANALNASLETLSTLPGDMTIYPGHGGTCSLSDALSRAFRHTVAKP